MYTIDIWNQHAAGVSDIRRIRKAVELRSEILIEFSKGQKQPSIITNFIVPVLESWNSLCVLLLCFEYCSINFIESRDLDYDSK